MKNGLQGIFFVLALLMGEGRLGSEPISVLMIGNSFTNGTAKVLEEMGQLADDLYLEWAYSNGKTLEWHYSNRTAAVYPDNATWTLQEKLRERTWDWVILQDQSLSATRLMPAYEFARWSATMIGFVRAEQPGARIGLFETWAYRSDSPDYGDTFTPLEFQEEVRDKYRQSALANGVVMIPVGEGFARYYRDNPYVWGDDWKTTSLHAPDTEHANQRGYYLAAAAIYGVALDTPFADAAYAPPFDTIPADLRTWLRHTAWSIAHYPSILTAGLSAGWPGSSYQASLSSFSMPGMPAGAYAVAGGALPPGLELNGNLISGVPTVAGSYSFDIALNVPDGEADFASYSIAIDPPPDTLVSLDVPRIDGDWWPVIAGPPDLGIYNSDTAEAVDFSIWQAEDGTWQLVSCIRNTAYPGRTRLFYRWESANLTDLNWTPRGIFAVSDPTLDPPHTEGRMQAPHCFKHDGLYYFFYNSYGAYCKVSTDGKNFTDHTDHTGSNLFFPMGRDLMILDAGSFDGNWYAYFLENRADGSAYMAARTSTDLRGPWLSPSMDIGHYGNPESPFVFKHNGLYYLWEQMKVYVSRDPRNFRNPSIGTLWNYRYAPEILEHHGFNYMAAYSDDRIWICRLAWDSHDYRASTNARLHQLDIAAVNLDPAFHPETLDYTATVDFATVAPAVFAISEDTMAQVIVSKPPALEYGRNLVGIRVIAEDGLAESQYTVKVVRTPPPNHPVPVILSTRLPYGSRYKPFDAKLSAQGGQTPYAWSIDSGTIPPGLVLGPDGAFAGVPSNSGLYTFLVTVTDANSSTATESFSIWIGQAEDDSVPLITAADDTLPTGWVGGPYVYTFPVAGGNEPLTYSVAAGVLPPGLTLDPATGGLGGTPTQAGFFAFSIRVTDFSALGGGDSTSATFLLSIGSSSPVTLNPVADASVKFNSPGVNDGANTFLYSSGAPANLTPYLKFDLSGLTGPAALATLRAYSNKSPGPYTAYLEEVADDSWTEMGIIPENAPVTGARIDTYTIAESPGYYQWDVTSYLNTEYHGDGVASFAIRSDTGTTWLGWHSRENFQTATRPHLVVAYPVDVPAGGYWGWILAEPGGNLRKGPWDANPVNGINNLLRYALDIPADSLPATGLMPEVVMTDSGQPVFRHPRYAAKADIIYIVESSTDLSGWNEVARSQYPDDYSADDWFELNIPAGNAFYRLKIEWANR